MLPENKPTQTYRTLDEIRQRKEELADQIYGDSTRISTLLQIWSARDLLLSMPSLWSAN